MVTSIIGYVLIVLCIVNILLGIYIFISRHRSHYSLSFLVLCFGISIWVISNFLFQSSDDLELAYYYNQLANVGALVLVNGLYFFSKNYPQTSFKKKKFHFIDRSNFGITLVFIFLSLIPNLIDKSIYINSSGIKSVEPNILKYVYFIVIIFNLSLILKNLILSYRKHTGIFKLQIKYLIFLFLGSALGGVAMNLILPALGLYDYVALGPAFTIFQTIGCVYCMLNYRYIDWRFITSFILEKVVFISILTSGTYILYKLFYSNNISLFIFLIIIFSLLFIFLYDLFKTKSANLYFLAPNFDYHLKAFQSEALLLETKDSLIKKLQSYLKKVLKISSISISLDDELSDKKLFHKFTNLFSKSDKKVFVYDEELKKYYDQLESNFKSIKKLENIKEQTGYQNIIQLSYLNRSIGYLLFSSRKQGEAFSIYEMLFLKKLVDIFSTYLYKLELYEQKENINSLLEQKIDEATFKLRKQKKELRQKYQFEKDMMGIMGHELRTPMTVAKGIAELMVTKARENDLEPKDVEDKMKKVYASIVKESDLIQTMLSSTHLDNNRLNLQISLVDLRESVQYSVLAFRDEAERKGLDFIYTQPKFTMPLIMLDSARTQEIANNLISNAVKYTKSGHVKIWFSKTEDTVTLNVEDTGIGIPEEEIKNLGKKFHRINQHLDKEKQIVRAGGTGLGLYVVKGLLDAFGGELQVESELGKGSIFRAVFPIISKYHNSVPLSVNSKGPAHDMFVDMGLDKK